jgi:O-acetyl-ADP-ribose deacetylase (regulator of RNase III)
MKIFPEQNSGESAEQHKRLLFLVENLLRENPSYRKVKIPADDDSLFKLFRSLVNVREPKSAGEEFLKIQDEFLREEIRRKKITHLDEIPQIEKNIFLWKGDITTLECDAIVNAANSKLLGCFSPCHACIDNAIHTFAGIQLRRECSEIMQKQMHDEETGGAKITEAYNLPSKFVIHTVGPVVSGELTQNHRELLASCYKKSLELAKKNSAESIAFCCISTGVFRFPRKEASEIAVKTVREFLMHDEIKVIFNVFNQEDFDEYKKILG